MIKTVPAVKARQQFSSLLNEIDTTGTSVIIERDGEAKAVIIPMLRFAAWEERRRQAQYGLNAQAERNQLLLDQNAIGNDTLMEDLVKASKQAREEIVR